MLHLVGTSIDHILTCLLYAVDSEGDESSSDDFMEFNVHKQNCTPCVKGIP